MKKIFMMLMLFVMVGCANETQIAPQQQLYVERPVVNTCNNCASSYTVRTPVSVMYKNTTYTTVYEPKTFTRTSYETLPYKCVEGELCR